MTGVTGPVPFLYRNNIKHITNNIDGWAVA